MIGACDVCNQGYSEESEHCLPSGLVQVVDDEEYEMVDGSDGGEDMDDQEFYRVIF